MVLDDGRAVLDPVAAIEIADAEILVDGGIVDVAADDAMGVVAVRFGSQRPLELADIVDRILDLQLRPLRQRPVGKAEPAPPLVEDAVQNDRIIVGLAAQEREPARLGHHEVKQVAVDDEIAPAVGADMDCGLDHLDAAEMSAVVIAQELVVIAGHIDQAHALAGLPQKLLHHVVVALRPVPGGLELPAVDDVADEIDRVRLMPAQEV